MIELKQKEYTIWKTLLDAGFETFVVGGAVRDYFLGIESHDIDFATKATPDQIDNVFSDSKFKLDFVGASFGVMLVAGVEVATFRGDRYFGGGDKDVEITYVDTIEEDLSRRDLTINAMAMDFCGNIIDPYDGEKDIKKRIIRFIGDANDRIKEDPNRILRSLRFSARFEFGIHIDTALAIRWAVDDGAVKLIAPERIRLEIMKTMESVENSSEFWGLLADAGVLEIIFPELLDGMGHDHGNHHEEDVWTHNMLTGDFIDGSDKPLMKLAGYLHDVGKPASYDSDNGTFYEHHTMGADIIRKRLTALKFSNDEIRFVVNLVLVHMDGTRGMTDKARRRLKNKLDKYGIDWREYLGIRIADRHANLSRPDFTVEQIVDYVEMFTIEEVVPFSVNDLALSGGDIIRIFHLEPSPIVGEIQREMLKFVIDNGDKFNKPAELVFNIGEGVFGLGADLDEIPLKSE